MSTPIVFLGGFSGAGKSTVMEWLADDMNFLPLEVDLKGEKGIDVHRLRHGWNCFRRLDPTPLANILRDKFTAANREGAVLSFPSDTIFSRDRIDAGRRVGIHTAILFGAPQHCIDAFLKRERMNGRGFDEKRWHSKNDRAVAIYSGPDYDDCRFDTFSADGSHRSREDLMSAFTTWLAA